MKSITILLAFLILLIASTVSGASSVRIGGYDVAQIASSTISVLEKKQVIGSADTQGLAALIDLGKNADPLVAAQSIVMFYDKLALLLVEKKILTAAEIESARAEAAQSGGVKAGGLNPVVLAASFLDAMSKKGIITVQFAQTILDDARTR